MSNDVSDGRIRQNVKEGYWVEVVQKHHQRSGELTEGMVKRLLTKSSNHPHGIKVQLDTGEVGRVKRVLEE
ncbi:MAG: YwbE family protein [Reichenbachiella sp.]